MPALTAPVPAVKAKLLNELDELWDTFFVGIRVGNLDGIDGEAGDRGIRRVVVVVVVVVVVDKNVVVVGTGIALDEVLRVVVP